MAKVLVVEDDMSLAASLSAWLKSEGHQVELVHDGGDGLELLRISGFDLALVDWHLPGMYGPEICARYRQCGGKTPILMLTVKSDVADKEEGLDAGADDYLPKPFNMRELAARVRALLRRSRSYLDDRLEIGRLKLDSGRHMLVIGDREVELVPREFELVQFLMRNAGVYIPTERLIAHVWSSDTEVTDEALRVCVRRIRKKVDCEDAPSIIDSQKGFGYKISDWYLQ